MATKNKILLGLAILIGIAIFAWSKRDVYVGIAGVTFRFPNQAVVSVNTTVPLDGLDTTQGAFIELPNGHYFGSWGLLLQSSKERGANGMSEGLIDALRRGDLRLNRTPFGWYEWGRICGREDWYFQRIPDRDSSIYSIGTLICHDTGICKLNFAYRDVDVQVSVSRQQIDSVSEVKQKAIVLLQKYEMPKEK